MTDKINTVKVFSDKPLPLSDLVRIASRKIKAHDNTTVFINILDAHYFKEYGVYVVLYSSPVLVTAISEGGMEQEFR